MPEQDPARRAVITGLGAVMPIGNDFPTYWSNLVAGVTGTRTIQSFDASAHEVRIAAEVLDFDPREHMDPKMARRMSRFIHFAMAAGKEAVADSGIDFAAMSQEQRDRVGVVVNTGGGGIEQVIDGTHVHDEKGPRFVSPFAVPALSGSMGAAMLSMEWGLTGPVITQVAACATSVIAFHDALRLIQTGECDVVVTGGTRSAHLADGGGRAGQHDGAVQAQRLPGDRVPTVRWDARRVRPGRGRRCRRRRVAGPRPRAWRDADRGDPGRCPDRRCVPHQRTRTHRPRAGPRDDATPCATAASRPTRSTTSSRTAPRRPSTT